MMWRNKNSVLKIRKKILYSTAIKLKLINQFCILFKSFFLGLYFYQVLLSLDIFFSVSGSGFSANGCRIESQGMEELKYAALFKNV